MSNADSALEPPQLIQLVINISPPVVDPYKHQKAWAKKKYDTDPDFRRKSNERRTEHQRVKRSQAKARPADASLLKE